MFFSLFTGNVVLKFVNQFHFTFGLKVATETRCGYCYWEYWMGREYN